MSVLWQSWLPTTLFLVLQKRSPRMASMCWYIQFKTGLKDHQCTDYIQFKTGLKDHQCTDYIQFKTGLKGSSMCWYIQFKTGLKDHQCTNYMQVKTGLKDLQCTGYIQVKTGLKDHQCTGYIQVKTGLKDHANSKRGCLWVLCIFSVQRENLHNQILDFDHKKVYRQILIP